MVTEVTFNGVLVERTVDNGDGTGTRTTYDDKGQVTSTEQVDGLPVVTVEPEPDPIADLAATIAAQQAQIDALLYALGGA